MRQAAPTAIWLCFLPDEEGAWRLLDLDGNGGSYSELGLYGPLRMGGRSAGAASVDQVVVLGRSAPESDAPLGHITLGEGIDPTPVIGVRNRLLPAAITTSGGDWMMAFEDGICTTLTHTEYGFGDELGSWPCGTGPGARLIGRGVMTGAGVGVYGAGQTASEFVVWDPRPGEHIHPGRLVIPSNGGDSEEEEESPSGDLDAGLAGDLPDVADSDATLGADADEASDAALSDPAPAIEPGPIQTIRETSSALQWLNPVPLGQALSLANGDTYLLTENEIVLLGPTASGNPLGVIHATGGALFRWNGVRWKA